MTLFELVKIALDELYSQGKKQHKGKLDGEIKGQLKYLKASFGELDLAERKPISYRDPATRFAYVYKYVASHGDYIVQVLELLREKLGGNIFDSANPRVSCVGGGPGSDIIAVLKYLSEYPEPVKKLTCYLLDKEQAWADTWTELDDSLSGAVSLHSHFQPLDVTDPNSWKFQTKFLQADLFTMSYFASEVHSLNKNGVVTKFWDALFDGAKSGAMFVYVDNGADLFNDYVDGRSKAAKLKYLLKQSNTRWIPRFSEQASELADYTEKFGHWPKLQAYLSYRVLRKP